MKYHRTYRHSTPRAEGGHAVGAAFGTLLALLALGGLFVFAVKKFRAPVSEPATVAESNQAVLSIFPSAFAARPIVGQQDMALQTARGDGAAGSATRRLEDGVFFHTIKAALPPIDRSAYAYRAWLVRPVPFDYFSTGEMVTNDAGEFVLEFQGDPRGAYEDYFQVLVTLQRKDGDPDPGEHVLEGEFK